MTSTTGRIPCMAAPIPAPTSAISEMGAFRTRSGPNSSSMPWVTPIEPPISAMSSPMMKTSTSRRIASESASRTASRYDSSGIDVLHGVVGLRVGAVLGELGRGLDHLHDLAADVRGVLVRQLKLRSQLVDRVLGLAQLLQLALGPVDLRIADVVAREPVGLHVEEVRALALTRVVERLDRRRID